MNLEVFCYLGMLRFPEQLEPSLKVLPEDERLKAESLLATLKDLPKAELAARWSRLREEEYTAMCRDVYQRTGIRLEALAPFIRECSIRWLVYGHE